MGREWLETDAEDKGWRDPFPPTQGMGCEGAWKTLTSLAKRKWHRRKGSGNSACHEIGITNRRRDGAGAGSDFGNDRHKPAPTDCRRCLPLCHKCAGDIDDVRALYALLPEVD